MVDDRYFVERDYDYPTMVASGLGTLPTGNFRMADLLY
jgi:hypothetical protein